MPASVRLAAYERARQECEECAAAVVALARLGSNTWREGREPSPEWQAMLSKATDAYEAAAAELKAAKDAVDAGPPSSDSP